ncbi:MAG TPA: serine hydrolase domain-containing protein [Candidatus Eisenbacteria bacterium]
MPSRPVSPRAFRALTAFLRSSAESSFVPGVVAAAGRADRLLYHEAFGRKALLPRREPAGRSTIYDLASLTKVMATAPAAVELATRGRWSLLDPLGRHLRETEGTPVGAIPLHHLLTHTAGFVPDNPLEDYGGDKSALYRAIAREPLASEPGTAFVYSDVGYVLLQGALERLTGRRLDRIAADLLFAPLGFRDTRFGTRSLDRSRVAPTERAGGRWLRGRVHDPRARARALSGVAGHAGMFGTAEEVARFASLILGRGVFRGRRVLAEATVYAMTTDQCGGNLGVRRGFGFDIESPYSAPRGSGFSRHSFGHSGWTGVSLWIDPEMDGYVALLTNSIHPNGHHDMKAFRAEAATLAARALAR